MGSVQVCSTCGHPIGMHPKGGLGAFDECQAGGFLDATHNFVLGKTTNVHENLKYDILGTLPPVTYLGLNGDAVDAGGLGNDGTWTGTELYATGADGAANGAADLNEASKINIATESNYDYVKATIAAITLWIKPDSTQAGAEGVPIAKKWDNSVGQAGWSVTWVKATEEITMRLGDGTTQQTKTVSCSADEWHLITILFAGTGFAIQVDNDPFGFSAYTIAGEFTNARPISIGSLDNNTLDFKGQVDGVAVWDPLSITPAMVSQIYKDGNMWEILTVP